MCRQDTNDEGKGIKQTADALCNPLCAFVFMFHGLLALSCAFKMLSRSNSFSHDDMKPKALCHVVHREIQK